jgi:hypothetical protein
MFFWFFCFVLFELTIADVRGANRRSAEASGRAEHDAVDVLVVHERDG